MPTALYSQLQQVALTGTRRLPLSQLTSHLAPAQNPIDHALYAALTQADTPDALRLLRAVAIATVTDLATWQGAPMAPEMDESALEPAPTPPSFSADIVQHMRAFMNIDDYSEKLLLFTLLRSLEEAKQSLPAELLVQALTISSQRPGYSAYTHKAVRPYVAAVLGERGYWLARQNPAWQWAAWLPNDVDDEIIWQQGNVEQRKALLLRERQTHPDAARERLATCFKQLNSKERNELIEVMEINLSMEDEPFLESLLQHTGRLVGSILREKIATLLENLPQSRHSQRIIAIMQGLLRQDKKGAWYIEPPEDFDPAWAQDGIAPDIYTSQPRSSRCLKQLVERTPLSFWMQTTGMSPAELFNWALKTDWKKELRLGWFEALNAKQNPDPIWIKLYLDNKKYYRDSISIVRKLPQPQREARWRDVEFNEVLFFEITNCQTQVSEFLSVEFSEYIFRRIQLLIKRLASWITSVLTSTDEIKKKNTEALVYLDDVILYLDNAVLPEVDTLLHTYQDQWLHYWPDLYQNIRHKLELRHQLLACQTAITARALATV